MDELREQILNCKKCNLCSTRTNAVPGEGDYNADIFFIGEAPGEREDIEGIPFCGRSGNLLTQMLNEIGLDRKDIFITNIVKCRPPGNRDPEENEIDSCKPYLKLQIALVKPKIICTLGRYSSSLFVKDKISKIHGQIFKFGKYTVIPLYHPAVGLYNPNMKKVMQEDFLKIKNFLKAS